MGTFNRNPEADTLLNLTSGDVAQLQKDVAGMPFDVQLLVENVSTIAALGQDAHAAVTGPGIMVLAIDPVAGHVLTRFGKSTGVKPSDFDSISKAGNAHFHNHEWVAGIETVAIRAQASAQTSTGIAQSSAPVVVEHGLSGGTWLLIALLGAGFIGIIVWLYRRSQRDREGYEKALDANRLETADLVGRNVEEMTLPDDPHTRNAKVLFPDSTPSPGRTVDGDGYLQPKSRRRTVQSAQPTMSRRSAVQPTSQPPWTGPRSTYSSAPVPVTPVVTTAVMPEDRFAEGLLIGEALSRPEREMVVEREVPSRRHSRSRVRDDDDDDSGGSDSVFDGGRSNFTTSQSDDAGGSDSSYTPSTSSDDSSPSIDIGGGSSDIDTGGGGGGSDDSGGGDSSF